MSAIKSLLISSVLPGRNCGVVRAPSIGVGPTNMVGSRVVAAPSMASVFAMVCVGSTLRTPSMQAQSLMPKANTRAAGISAGRRAAASLRQRPRISSKYRCERLNYRP